MQKEEFYKIISYYASKININLNIEQKENFYKYMNLLLEWNENINLTAITKPDEIILKHFIDSLTISKFIHENAKVIDVGTGAGFPGIPLKIIRDDIEVTLLDSLNKRINFLNEVIKKLNLSKIEAIHSRVEDLAHKKEYREKFDISTSRAVANLSTLSEYLLPLTRVGGKVIAMKGQEINEEINNAKNAINILNGKIDKIDSFYLYGKEMKRNNIIIEKVKNAPIEYPRRAGLPSKKPIV